MKKFFALFAAASLFITSAVIQVSAMEHAEWYAYVYDDDNYDYFGDGIGDFTPEYAVDGSMESAWQKQAGIMDGNGYIAEECFIALEWDETMVIESVNIWWRSSTRAEASKTGYVLQTGVKTGNTVKWEDVKATYNYNCEDDQNGRFTCDTITINGTLETTLLRVLVKRGIDYLDPDRFFSPKINEIEVAATEKEDDTTVSDPPVMSTPSEDTSSDDPASGESSSEGTASENTSADTSSDSASSSGSSQSARPTFPTVSSDADSQNKPDGDGSGNLIPWIILGSVSLVVIVVSVVIIILNSKKTKMSTK